MHSSGCGGLPLVRLSRQTGCSAGLPCGPRQFSPVPHGRWGFINLAWAHRSCPLLMTRLINTQVRRRIDGKVDKDWEGTWVVTRKPTGACNGSWPANVGSRQGAARYPGTRNQPCTWPAPAPSPPPPFNPSFWPAVSVTDCPPPPQSATAESPRPISDRSAASFCYYSTDWPCSSSLSALVFFFASEIVCSQQIYESRPHPPSPPSSGLDTPTARSHPQIQGHRKDKKKTTKQNRQGQHLGAPKPPRAKVQNSKLIGSKLPGRPKDRI